ncbi:MAG TPA: DUF1587 domain-containing protein, partial [Chthoniobacteraceae bacterium]|nr:DUF1587 domain-containing protein [Chthoniobacteraceae bacterium]
MNPKLRLLARVLACWGGISQSSAAPAPELVEVRKIWDAAPHNAFTDLARWRDAWWCVFREADGHIGGDGRIRVLTSRDGVKWESAALIAEEGIDLRDPKICVTPDGRAMLTLGGSVYRGGKKLLGAQPRVVFSKDGREWTAPQHVLDEGEWLWRVTWHGGTAYGISYKTRAPINDGEWSISLFSSSDGLKWESVAALNVSGQPNETTLRFRPDGEMLALVRRESADKQGWLGRARPPYRDWQWKSISRGIGGPEFLVLGDGRLLAAGRDYRPAPEGAKTAVGWLDDAGWQPALTLPSGGDTSYPGMVEHDGQIWVSYYASHEGKSAIYVAKVRIPAGGAAAAGPPDFDRGVRPILKEFCLDCHSTEKQKGDLDLEVFTSLAEVRRHPKIWQSVSEQLTNKEMPPKKKPQPSPEVRDQLESWVRAILDDIARERAGDPGPVVLRRLSNAEYTYTIRDLTGVESLDPAREFPVDGAAGEGFTNTGQSLVMSPSLVTKYLDAGKDIAAHAVLLPDSIRFSPSTSQRDWTEEK